MGGTASKGVIPATAMRVADGVDYRSAPSIASRRSQRRASWRRPSQRAADRPASSCDTGCARNHCVERAAAGRESACVDAATTRAPVPTRHARTGAFAHRHRTPELASIEMRTCSVLARLRIRRDDFGIYQGYRRYADIVAGRACARRTHFRYQDFASRDDLTPRQQSACMACGIGHAAPIPAQPGQHAARTHGPRIGLPTEPSRRAGAGRRRRPNHAIKGSESEAEGIARRAGRCLRTIGRARHRRRRRQDRFRAPLTGPQSNYGTDMQKGVQLAIADFNATRPTIGGKPVTFQLDSQDDRPTRAPARPSQRLIDDNVRGIIGHFNSARAFPRPTCTIARGCRRSRWPRRRNTRRAATRRPTGC